MPNCGGCGDRAATVIKDSATIKWQGNGSADRPYVGEATSSEGGGTGGGWEPGDVKWTARATAPAGWLIADGAVVSRTTYANLFTAIGTAYGAGDGVNTFNLPDWTGRFMMGASPAHPRGEEGGEAGVTIGINNLPPHKHTIGTSGAHKHSWANTRSSDDGNSISTKRNGQAASGVETSPDGTHTHEMSEVGGGEPLQLLPPYATAVPLIKT